MTSLALSIVLTQVLTVFAINPNECFTNSRCFVDDNSLSPLAYNHMVYSPTLTFCLRACMDHNDHGLTANLNGQTKQVSCTLVTYTPTGECKLYDQQISNVAGQQDCYTPIPNCGKDVGPSTSCVTGPKNVEIIGHTVREFYEDLDQATFDGSVEACKRLCKANAECKSLTFYPKDAKGPAECVLQAKKCSDPANADVCKKHPTVLYFENEC